MENRIQFWKVQKSKGYLFPSRNHFPKNLLFQHKNHENDKKAISYEEDTHQAGGNQEIRIVFFNWRGSGLISPIRSCLVAALGRLRDRSRDLRYNSPQLENERWATTSTLRISCIRPQGTRPAEFGFSMAARFNTFAPTARPLHLPSYVVLWRLSCDPCPTEYAT